MPRMHLDTNIDTILQCIRRAVAFRVDTLAGCARLEPFVPSLILGGSLGVGIARGTWDGFPSGNHDQQLSSLVK